MQLDELLSCDVGAASDIMKFMLTVVRPTRLPPAYLFDGMLPSSVQSEDNLITTKYSVFQVQQACLWFFHFVPWYRIGIALPGPHRLHAVSASAFPLSQQRAALSEIAGRSDP